MDNKKVEISKGFNRAFLIVFLAGLLFGVSIPAASANTIKQFDVEEGDAFWYDLTVNVSEAANIDFWTNGGQDSNDVIIASLYDSNGNQIKANSFGGGGGRGGLNLDYPATAINTYKVRIYLFDANPAGKRAITISSPQSISPIPHYNETVSNATEGDPVWFPLIIDSTGVVGINVWTDGLGIQLSLHGPSGENLIPSSGSNGASIISIATRPGIYKVRVIPISGRYGPTGKISVSSNYPLRVNTPTPAPTSIEGKAEQKTFTNSIGMEFVQIPAGEFDMGSPVAVHYNERPVHHVNISKAFYLGIYEVTQKQWMDIMGYNPSSFKGDALPVEQVSWYDVQQFIKKLNEKEKEEGNYYRLPSEAEWEYAARAGTNTTYSFGNNEKELGDYAWHGLNSGGTSHPVGKKKPNPWGLYDMHGNVWEWVQDIMYGTYDGAPTDGSARETGIGDMDLKVNRGGSWNGPTDLYPLRSSVRVWDPPNNQRKDIGFRLVRASPSVISEVHTSQNATVANIVIDGNPQDWAGIKPIMTDPEGDSKNVQGSDLKSLYALNDNEFIYLMLEVYDNPNGSKEKVQYVFEIANNTDSPFLKWDYEIGSDAQGNTWLWNLTEYDTRVNNKDTNPYGRTLRPLGVEAAGKAVFEMKIPLYLIGNPKNMIIHARTQPQSGGDFYDDMLGAKFITNPSLVIHEKQTPAQTLTPTHGEELKNENQLSEGLKYFAFPALASLAVLGIVLFLEKREKNKLRFKDYLRTRHWLGYYSTLICNFIVGAVFVIVSVSVFIKELPVSFDAGKFYFTIPLFYLSVSSFILTIGLLRLKPVKKLNILHFIISLLMGIFLIFVTLTDPEKSPPVIFPILVLLSSVISVWYDKVAIFRPEYAQESLIQKSETKLSPEPEIKRGYVILSDNDIKFGIRVTNNTGYTITDVDAILDHNEELFNLKESKILRIGNIPPDTARTAAYRLKPLGCIHNEQINALISYKDHTGKKHALHMRPKEVHCVCPFLKEKSITRAEFLRLSNSGYLEERGVNFEGIDVDKLLDFLSHTCKNRLYKVDEIPIENGMILYLAGDALGEKAHYLLTAIVKEYEGLTQVLLRANSDKNYGLNGFLNEILDNLRHLVVSASAREIGIIKKEQVINIIDSVVQRTSFDLGAGGNTLVNIKDSVVLNSDSMLPPDYRGNTLVNIKDSVVQHTVIKGDEDKLEEKLRKGKEFQAGDAKAPEYQERMENQGEKATPFEEIWSRIIINSGELFHTKTGLEFTYKIEGDRFYPSRTDYAISKTDFRTAYELVPIDGPGVINDKVRGPAYVWAVLHDQMISNGEW